MNACTDSPERLERRSILAFSLRGTFRLVAAIAISSQSLLPEAVECNLRQRKRHARTRPLIVQARDLSGFGVNVGIAQRADERAGRIGTLLSAVLLLPLAEPGLRRDVRKRPADRKRAHPATPRLWRQARAKAFLRTAQLHVKRIGTERLHDVARFGSIGCKPLVRRQQPQPRPSAVDAKTP